jgi:predicted GNAT family N-acyltransferase
VFVQEQGIPAELEQDAADFGAVHAVATNRLGQPLATGRLLQRSPGVAQVGRLAVLQAVRGSQLGRQVLQALIEAARERGDHELMLHSQSSATGFYLAQGFRQRGPAFEEAGIEHVELFLVL